MTSVASALADDLIHPLAAPFRLDGRNGEAFVLVHGFTGNPAHMRDLAMALHGRGYTINVPLLPGHAHRFETLASATREDWSHATVDAVREVGDHHRIHLVGLSMGGLLAIVAGVRTAASTLTTINSPIAFRNRSIHLAFLARRFRPEVRWPPEPPPPLDDEVAPFWIHTDGFPTMAGAELTALSRLARRAAPHFQRPSLVIQSKADESVHPRSGQILRRALGDQCRLLWLEQSMHNAMFDSERHAVREAILRLVTT
jgi:carboxylesterase